MGDHVFVLRLDGKLYETLTALAGNTDRSRAGYVRHLIKQAAGSVPDGTGAGNDSND